jgi:hypothetical protein
LPVGSVDLVPAEASEDVVDLAGQPPFPAADETSTCICERNGAVSGRRKAAADEPLRCVDQLGLGDDRVIDSVARRDHFAEGASTAAVRHGDSSQDPRIGEYPGIHAGKRTRC